MFEQILDIVGSRDQWPPDVIRYFWRLTPRGSDYLDYSERFRLSVFMYVNEVPFEMFYNWCLRVNLLRDRAAREHISRLYSTFQYDYARGEPVCVMECQNGCRLILFWGKALL